MHDLLSLITELVAYFLVIQFLFHIFNPKIVCLESIFCIIILISPLGKNLSDLLPVTLLLINIFLFSKEVRKIYTGIAITVFVLYEFINMIITVIIRLFLSFYPNRNFSPSVINIFSHCVILSLVVIFLIICSNTINKFNLSELSLSMSQMISIITTTALIELFFVYNMYIVAEQGRYHQLMNFVTIILSLLYLFSTFRYIIIQKKNNELKQQELELRNTLNAQHQYIDSTILHYEELRQFRHNLRPHVIALHALAEKNKQEEMLYHIDQMLEPLTKSGKYYTGNSSIDAVIASLEEVIDQNDIQFHFIGNLNLRNDIDTFDICIILYNVLTNAIEECCQIPDQNNRWIRMTIESFPNQESIRIKEENYCRIKQDHSNIGTLPTSKDNPDAHGIGMLSIRHIVSRYNGKVRFFIKDHVFFAQILL